jgi:hypothetical protein
VDGHQSASRLPDDIVEGHRVCSFLAVVPGEESWWRFASLNGLK